MPKEACALLTLTVSLFGIICMAKGLSTQKESAIKENSNHDKDLTYKGVLYGDNEIDYENDYFRKKRCAKDKNVFEPNLNEKSESIIPINTHLKTGAAIKNHVFGSDNEQIVDNSGYDFKILNKRNSLGSLRRRRKNPLSYLHINHNKKSKQPEIYIISANDFSADLVRRFTRTETKNEFPVCDINENQEKVPEFSTISRSNLEKRGLGNNQMQISPINLSPDLIRKVRSQWRYRDHYKDFNMENKKYESPIENNQNNNWDQSKRLNTHSEEEDSCFYQSNNDENNSQNFMMKRGALDEAQLSSSCKKQQTPTEKEKSKEKKDKNKEKKNELCTKSIGNKMTTVNKKGDSKDSVVANETSNTDNNISFNNASDQVKIIQSQESSDQSQIHSTEQSVISDNKEKNEVLSYFQKENLESVPLILSNITNNDFEHSEKNKIQTSNVIQSPSIAPLTLPNGVVPNISYVYLQPLPFGNSMFLNQAKPADSSSKKNDQAENKTNDLITISIDPRTLQNKVLHAEFMKKSDVKKTPDTLSIELSPKETNSSKHQKTVQKPLKISASVKNNSIFISGGDTSGYNANTLNEKKHQKYQSFSENIGKSKTEKESYNSQIKSGHSRLGNGVIYDGKSSQECNLKNDEYLNDKDKTDETKVLIIKAKQKEVQVCATEPPCKQLSTYCSINLCDSESHCKRTTWNVQNFREVHEIVSKDDKDAGPFDFPHSSSVASGTDSSKASRTENKTMTPVVNDDSVAASTSSSMYYGVKVKREADQMNISKLINILKPVLVLGPKVDNEGIEDESESSAELIDKVNLKGSPEIAFEKGNKKVENKILEGFINSIIANYTKDEVKPLMKETTEKSEDGAEALLKMLENNIPKRSERDQELAYEDKSNMWNLTPILVPESSISKYSDNSEYAKLGPFDENFIKSFLKKEYIPSLYKKKK